MGMFSSIASFAGGLISNEANRKEGSKNRSFQKDMSSTSHVREVADLKAAGLNPILSSKYGGSSTPPGSMATFQNPLAAAADTSVKDKSATSQVSLQKQMIDESQAKAQLASSTAKQIDLGNYQTEALNAYYDKNPAMLPANKMGHPALSAAALANGLIDQRKPTTSNRPKPSSSAKQVLNHANPWLHN